MRIQPVLINASLPTTVLDLHLAQFSEAAGELRLLLRKRLLTIPTTQRNDEESR